MMTTGMNISMRMTKMNEMEEEEVDGVDYNDGEDEDDKQVDGGALIRCC